MIRLVFISFSVTSENGFEIMLGIVLIKIYTSGYLRLFEVILFWVFLCQMDCVNNVPMSLRYHFGYR